jgi:hypothetical protein
MKTPAMLPQGTFARDSGVVSLDRRLGERREIKGFQTNYRCPLLSVKLRKSTKRFIHCLEDSQKHLAGQREQSQDEKF